MSSIDPQKMREIMLAVPDSAADIVKDTLKKFVAQLDTVFTEIITESEGQSRYFEAVAEEFDDLLYEDKSGHLVDPFNAAAAEKTSRAVAASFLELARAYGQARYHISVAANVAYSGLTRTKEDK